MALPCGRKAGGIVRRTAKPEDAIQIILSRQLRQPFTVISIVPITDKNKVVLGYMVLVSR